MIRFKINKLCFYRDSHTVHSSASFSLPRFLNFSNNEVVVSLLDGGNLHKSVYSKQVVFAIYF